LWTNTSSQLKEIMSPTEAFSSGNESPLGMSHARLIFLAWVMGVCVRRIRVRGMMIVGDIMLGVFGV